MSPENEQVLASIRWVSWTQCKILDAETHEIATGKANIGDRTYGGFLPKGKVNPETLMRDGRFVLYPQYPQLPHLEIRFYSQDRPILLFQIQDS